MNNAEPEQASRALARSVAAVSSLRHAVESRNLGLDPETGGQIRAALEDHLTTVDGWLSRAGDLARHAPLGQNPVGTAMAAKFANRADGDETSFTEVLNRYREVLESARDAINDAMRTYRETDERAADSLRKIT
ncbi:hypothetical protein [Saccharopolyspora phatthalungensis]|uniref:PE domain-containing protein n=1 Tax=Saccharopolyspora phatthalungensis TaxID=664693 RepID=A0A840Q388_9PSEU|nr:hypothetical protein [Saccharopolyspora phatthalungensis]MBB5154380.1 hypothetical protein [Saccharopolyspora phatthalungensis]